MSVLRLMLMVGVSVLNGVLMYRSKGSIRDTVNACIAGAAAGGWLGAVL